MIYWKWCSNSRSWHNLLVKCRLCLFFLSDHQLTCTSAASRQSKKLTHSLLGILPKNGKKFLGKLLGLDERECRWIVTQDFQRNSCIIVTCFFGLFLWRPWLNRANFGTVWKISSACTLQRKNLCLTIKTDDVASGRRDVDSLGWLWVVQGWMG